MADLEKEVIASPAAVDNKASSLSLLDEANQAVEKTLGPVCAPKLAPTGLDIPAFLDPRNLQVGTTTIRQEAGGLQVTDPLVRLQSQFGPKRFSLGVSDGANATGALIGRNPDGLTAAARVPDLGEFAFRQREKTSDFYADSPIFGALKLMRDKSGDKLSFAGDTGTVDLQQKGKTVTGSAVVPDVGAVTVTQDGKKLTASATAPDGRTVAVEQTGRTVTGSVVVPEVGSVQVTNDGGKIGGAVSVADLGKVSIEQKGKTVTGSAVVLEVGSVQVTQDGRNVSAKATVADVGSVNVDQKGKTVVGSAVIPEVGSIGYERTANSMSAKFGLPDFGSFGFERKGATTRANLDIPETGSLGFLLGPDRVRLDAKLDDISLRMEQRGSAISLAAQDNTGSFESFLGANRFSTALSRKDFGSFSVAADKERWSAKATVEQGNLDIEQTRTGFEALVGVNGVGRFQFEQKGLHNRNAFLNSDTYGSLRFTESGKGTQVSIQDKLFGGSARILDTPNGTRIVVDTLPRIPGTTLGAEGKFGVFNYKSQIGLSDATLTLDATVGDAQLRARVTETYNVTNLINGNPEKFKQQLGQPRAEVSVVLPHGAQAALKFEPGSNGRTGAPMIEVGRHGSLPNGNQLDLNLKFNPATNRTSYSVEAGGSKTLEYGPRVPSRPVRTFRYGVSATGGEGNQPGLAGKLQLDF